MPERRGEQNTSGHSNAHTDNLNKCFGPNKDVFFVPHTKKTDHFADGIWKKNKFNILSPPVFEECSWVFFNNKMINGTPFHMWFQIPVFTDSLKLSFDFASDELAESVVTHEILPQLVCATIHRLGWGSRFGKSGPSARVRWEFFIEMHHLYKMI